MRITLLCLLLSLLSLANANELNERRKKLFESSATCDQAIFSDDLFLATSAGNMIHVKSLVGKEEIVFYAKDSVVDIKIENELLYVLTETTLESWDLKSKGAKFVYNSHPQIERSNSKRERASGFIINNGIAIISHGVWGISLVDIATGESKGVVPMPTVSSAQDIALLDNNTAVIAVDNNDEGAFRGIYLLDLKTFGIVKQIIIDNPYSSSIRVLPNNRLMLGFFNAIWKFETNASVSSKKEAMPKRRVWKFSGLDTVDMKGKVFFDEQYLYGCFNVTDRQSEERESKPLTFDLKILKLN